MATNVKALINKATERANTPKKSGKPIFLFFHPGEKALIRPLFNLEQAITLRYHNKWHDNADYRINAVCASEIGKPCQHCEDYKTLGDKTLRASDYIFLPVFVHQVIDVATGRTITFEESDEHGDKQQKPVYGYRVLELPPFGKPLAILQVLNSYERDEPAHDIRACDFSIEQSGSGQSKNFHVKDKDASPMKRNIASGCPSIERFRDAIIEARTPLVFVSDDTDVASAVSDAMTVVDGDEDDDIPAF